MTLPAENLLTCTDRKQGSEVVLLLGTGFCIASDHSLSLFQYGAKGEQIRQEEGNRARLARQPGGCEQGHQNTLRACGCSLSGRQSALDTQMPES